MATHPACDDAMQRLESLGVERQRKLLTRQGTRGAAFGVPYADLYKLQKELGVDQPLAESLWQSGNHDARILATLIADPEQIGAAQLDRWAKTIDNEFMLWAVASIALPTARGRARAEKWAMAKSEWLAAAGWHLLGGLAAKAEGPFEEGEVLELLERIEAGIGAERNRVKHSMNGALIAMSAFSPALRKRCLAVAKKIGVVEVDHGATSCRTPPAGPYINKIAARAAAKKKTKKK